jgi:AcrR family transcriptional regulator
MPPRDPFRPRKVPRQERAKATVDAILTAAARILRDEGYARAGVNKIARAAGVSVGSLYQYFPTQEALVAAVVTRHNHEMIAAFRDGLTGLESLSPRELVQKVLRRVLAAYAVDRRLYSVIVHEVPAAAHLVRADAHEAAFRSEMRELVAGLFEAHAETARPVDVPLATRILLAAVEAAVAELASDPDVRLDDPAIADELAALVLGYVERR